MSTGPDPLQEPSPDAAEERRPVSRGRRLAFLVAAVLIAAAFVEVGCRLMLAFFPGLYDPWAATAGSRFNADFVRTLEENLESSAVEKRKKLYSLDPELFWRLNPDISFEVENTFYEMHGDPMLWDIRTNSLGFRADECPPADFDGVRILCLGDSCTFGLRVRQDRIYASRLGDRLEETAPGRPVHVLDAGVPGYTSYQGRLLLERLLDRYPADIVTIAFGANDLEEDVISDATRGELLSRATGRIGRALGQTGFGRVLQGLVGRGKRAAPDGNRRVPRVSEDEYRANVVSLIDAARRSGAGVALLDLVFIGPRFEAILEGIARERGVPLYNARREFDRAFDAIRSGSLYGDEVAAWMEFYKTNVKAYRPIYYGPEFYEQRYATERAQQQFITLMADPIHPNSIGHRLIADWLAPRCKEMLERGGE